MIQANEPITKPQLVREEYGGETYEYYPLGEYVVVAPGVCGGRPTFKYTRLEASMVLAMLERGDSPETIIKEYAPSALTRDAIAEVIRLAHHAFLESARPLTLAI
ncbi:MAG: hypothetical protein DCC52_10035 [Chloroflexi bacterium]|nr:MAG: hypothetical protein DCC52_10035 [Chloroflexota bacterium]